MPISRYKTITADYTVEYGVNYLFVDTSKATKNIQITLPKCGNKSEQAGNGYVLEIKDSGFKSSQKTITITGFGTDKVNNETSFTISENGEYVILKSDGLSNWLETGSNKLARPYNIISIPFSSDIDAKVLGTTDVSVVTNGRKFIIDSSDINAKNVTGAITKKSDIKFKTSSGVDLTGAISLSKIDKTDDTHKVDINKKIVGGAGDTKIQVEVTTTATGSTTLTLEGVIRGYYLN